MFSLKMGKYFALLLATFSLTSQALECNGTGCKCSSTIGIGFVQGTDGTGTVPNFEVAVPHTGGGFSAYYRNNFIADTDHVKSFSWFGPKTVSDGDINGIALLENAVYNPAKNPFVPGNGNLEVMAIKYNNLYHYWRDRTTKEWSSGTWIAGGVIGQPGFTQSKKWHDNFEVVVALQGGGLAHYWRDNTNPSMPWTGPTVFAQGRTYESVSLIESNFGDGNLEVIARSGQTLYHLYREGDTSWSTPREILVDGNNSIPAKGVHSFVQGKSGTKGDFELIVPLMTGGLGHYSRNNDNKVNDYYLWSTVTNVDATRNYTSAAVIASGFSNLELVARRENDGALVAFYSNSTYDAWSTKAGNPGTTPLWAGAVFGGEPCSDTRAQGRWQDPYHASAIGIHTALQPNGKVLMFGFADDNDMGDSIIFDPANGANEMPAHDHNNHNMPHAFCSGHALLSNGKLWIAGGHGDDHIADSFIFDSANASWKQLDDLGPNPTTVPDGDGRWYPTLTRLENGSVLVISGSMHVGRTENPDQINSSWQIMDVNENLSAKKSVPKPFAPAVSATNSIMMYPFVYQLPQGGVFVHSERTSRIFYPINHPTDNYWEPNFTPNTQYAYNRNYPGSGSSVMLPLSPSSTPALNYAARIMVFGGSGNVSLSGKPEGDNYVPATNTVEMLDFGKSATPSWEYKTSMKHARVLNNAVLLPDGNVFVVGGSSYGASDLAAAPVMIPEIYNPTNNTWTEMAPMRVARLYHSTAMLLPDGRVMTAGRDHAWNPYPYKWPERRVEIFSPPYLETGNARPVISSVTTNQSFGQSFNVSLGSGVGAWNIRSATLIAPGAVTHAYDQSQRAINLEITGRSNSGLTLKAPPNGKVAPPGYYMLFLVSDQGVPSVSKFIKLQ